jgi:hypothetical protein
VGCTGSGDVQAVSRAAAGASRASAKVEGGGDVWRRQGLVGRGPRWRVAAPGCGEWLWVHVY